MNGLWMQNYEREFLLSRILFGTAIIKVNKDLTLYVHPLTVEQNLFAQQAFKEAYDEALLSGVFARTEMLDLMYEQEVWTEEQEELLERNKKKIDDMKVKLYENFFVPQHVKKIKEDLKLLQREQLRLFGTKHTNDHLDCEGTATYARWNWIIENTTTYKNGDPYLFEELDVPTVLKRHNDQKITPTEHRELARTSPWRNIWINSENSAKKAFGRNPNELSEEQSNLLDWTRLYDNIAESPEAPNEKIIDDDDAIDGWLILQRRNREKQQSKDKLDGFESKHPGADEVYITTRSEEEAKQVYDLNDAEGRHVVKSRMEKVKKSGNKGVKYQEFQDVKMKAMNAANAKFG